MTGPVPAPDVVHAVARGHRTALLRAWRLVAIAVMLSAVVLAGSLTLRGAAIASAVTDNAALPPTTPAVTASAASTPAVGSTTPSPSLTVETTTPTTKSAAPDTPSPRDRSPAAPVITSARASERPDHQWDITVSWNQPDTGGPVTGYTIVISGSLEYSRDGATRDIKITAGPPGEIEIIANGPGGHKSSDPKWPEVVTLKTSVDPTPPSTSDETSSPSSSEATTPFRPDVTGQYDSGKPTSNSTANTS
jgi:hypothetical protein